jgi:hypothetical protein
MSTNQTEVLIPIAVRVAPGDRWRMVVGADQTTIHPTLTDALERYATDTGVRCPFRLDPFEGNLYAIRSQDAPEPEVRRYSIYDED